MSFLLKLHFVVIRAAEQATRSAQTEWPRASQTHLTSIQMGRNIKRHISANPEEADPDTTMTDT